MTKQIMKRNGEYVAIGKAYHVVYDVSDGRIIQSGCADPGLEPLHVLDYEKHDYLCVDELYDPNRYRVDLLSRTIIKRDDVDPKRT